MFINITIDLVNVRIYFSNVKQVYPNPIYMKYFIRPIKLQSISIGKELSKFYPKHTSKLEIRVRYYRKEWIDLHVKILFLCTKLIKSFPNYLCVNETVLELRQSKKKKSAWYFPFKIVEKN